MINTADIKESARAKRRVYMRRLRAELRKDPVKWAAFQEEARLRTKIWRERDGGQRRKMLFVLDPSYKLACRIKGRVRAMMKIRGAKTQSKYQYLFGCTFEEFTAHIQRNWKDGMGWNNYGRGADKWNLDHVRPLSSFDLLDEEQRRLAFHFSNIEPSWAIDNIRKNSVWNGRRWKHSDHRKESVVTC